MATQERIELLQRRSFGEIVGDTFTFIRLNLGVLLKVHFLLSLPMVIVTAAVFVLLFRDHFSLIGTVSSGVFEDAVAFRDDVENFMVARLFSMFAVMPVSINTFLVVDRYYRSPDGVVKFEDVSKLALRKYLKVMLAKLIIAPIIFFTGLLLFFPGLAFFTLFLCVEMLIIQHDFGVFKAIGKSSSIMTQHFWNPFLLNFCFITVYLIFIGLMQVPVLVLEQMQDLTVEQVDPDSAWSIAAISFRTFNTILSYVLYTIPTVSMAMMYYSIRERSSQGRIMERIRSIGSPKVKSNAFGLGDEQY